jgi:hypothetical protein
VGSRDREAKSAGYHAWPGTPAQFWPFVSGIRYGTLCVEYARQMAETKKKLPLFSFEVDVSDVPIVKAEEHFNQYVLEDGSVLRVKNVATSMLRVDGQFLPDGSPIYIVVATPAVSVESSPLKKPPEAAKEKVKIN